MNQAVILIGYWWSGILTWEVGRLAGVFSAPALAGLVVGLMLFRRVDQRQFRRIIFGVLLLSGLGLLLKG